MPKAPERPASFPECRSIRKIRTTEMITWMTLRTCTWSGSLALRDLFARARPASFAAQRPRRRRCRLDPVEDLDRFACAARRRAGRSPRRRACRRRGRARRRGSRGTWLPSARRPRCATEGAAAAAARGPERDQRPGQGDQAADPHPGDERVDDHLEGRRRAVGDVALGDPVRRSAPAARSICASAAGRRLGLAAAARISAATALHCGGVPGAPRDAGAEACVGRARPGAGRR